MFTTLEGILSEYLYISMPLMVNSTPGFAQGSTLKPVNLPDQSGRLEALNIIFCISSVSDTKLTHLALFHAFAAAVL